MVYYSFDRFTDIILTTRNGYYGFTQVRLYSPQAAYSCRGRLVLSRRPDAVLCPVSHATVNCWCHHLISSMTH